MTTNEPRLVSVFRHKFDTGLTKEGLPDPRRLPDISIQEFLEGIQKGTWKKEVERVREAIDNKAEYDKRKSTVPGVTIWGTFVSRKADKSDVPSGLMSVDLDHLPESELDRVFNTLKADPYVFAVFRSIGGKGLCVIFRVDYQKWLESFEGIRIYLTEQHGLVMGWDSSVKDICRLRFVSYHPEAYTNYKAQLFKKYPRKEKKQAPKLPFTHTDEDIRFVIDQIHARSLDLTGSYEDWFRIGWALISEYNEEARGLFHEVSGYHDSYDANDCDAKFNYLVATRPHSITIKTFYWYCRQAGLDTETPRTKEIQSVAAMSKKQKISQQSALDTVLSMTGASQEQARPIIEQVYASSEEFTSSETLFAQLELFLKQEYPMRRNEISHYIEDSITGRGLVDEDFNGIWVHAVKVLGEKVSDKMVNKLIHSSFTPTYNPLKRFFQENKSIKPVGLIKALADTIETNSGLDDNSFFPDYAEFIIRKWLLGMVSAVYDEHCPLVLVLTGKKGTGKTEWFRRLLPPELKRYFAETTWPISKDTDMLMSENWITFNDEWKGKTVKDPETLKGYASIDQFTLREPYGKSMVKRRRLALMCGTSNPTQIISDPDNNRKIVAINVKSVDYAAYNAINKTDLLMEVYHAYMDGERHHLTKKDIDRIADEVKGFEDYSLEHNLITEYMRIPTGAGGEDVQRLSTTKIMLYLENKANGRKLSETMVGRELAVIGYEKKRYRGDDQKRLYGYDVIFDV